MKELQEFYFSEFEDRLPEPPLPHNKMVEFVWQTLAVATIFLGFWYLSWRWMASLNPEAMWFSVPVAVAESCAFFGLILYFHNLWKTSDTPPKPAPEQRSSVVNDGQEGLISVDVFIPTFNENPELIRYSIRDAKHLTYPHPIDLRIHVLDDGRRDTVKTLAAEEGVDYITRADNIGFKAGNLRNGIENTSGDFILILDADTRPFPTLLAHTLGYFRDPGVAWVQTPQWFYDIPEGCNLDQVAARKLGRIGGKLAASLQKLTGPIKFGSDPFVSDPKLFYDVIQRRRNCANASFCCGAGSLHRREAIMETALKDFSARIEERVQGYVRRIKDSEKRKSVEKSVRSELAQSMELMPYKFHVSEDIYTSISLHSDPDRNWKSVYHPRVESKMLSPLDLQSWAIQRFKYAGGTLDILVNDNPLWQKGMTVRRKLMYAMTFWSYLSPLWNIVFIAAPIFALFTGFSPVEAYTEEFFLHLLPFLVVHELAAMVGSWGVNNRKGRMLNLAFFSINLRAIWTILCGREINFSVTPKHRNEGQYLNLVAPQITVCLLTLAALAFAGTKLVIDPTNEAIGSFVVNGFWALNNAWAMTVLIRAAVWSPPIAKDQNSPVLASAVAGARA